MEPAFDKSKHTEPESKAAPQRGSAIKADPQLHPALQLQQQAGNQAMQQLLRAGAIRARLSISQPNDLEEQEADATADRIMRSHAAVSAAATSCSCGTDEEGMCGECQQKAAGISRKAADSAPPHTSSRVLDTIKRSSGHPLDTSARAFFEPRFGRDFSSVRVHTDADAAASARSIQAHAYAAGDHLVFDTGRFAPETEDGRRLLAHELSHTIQQQKGTDKPSILRQPKSPTAGQPKSYGHVLFVQVDRTANTITFITESGSLVYALLSPAEVPAGSYRFAVAVTGNNLQLTKPAEITSNAQFRYRIAAGQPNPASLLRGEHEVTVQVIEGAGARAASTATQNQAPDTETSKVHFQVQVLTPQSFQAMTGVSADTLSENKLVNGSSLAPSAIASSLPGNRPTDPNSPFPSSDRDTRGAGLLPGIGGAALLARFPSYPIPPNDTGIIWTQVGAGHLSVFANVGGNMVPRGFRYDMWWNLFPSLRETGVPGSFQNDFLFTLMPNQTIVYRNSSAAAAQSFAERLLGTRYDQTYRFPPRVGSGVTVCGANCINVPADEVAAALGVRPEILTPQGPVDITQAGRPTPDAPFEPSQAGRGATMREFLGQDDSYFSDRGLTRMSVPAFTPAARGAVSFIKVGGAILMIYGAYRSYERIRDTPEAERPRVEMEEGGSWVGGALGSALGTAGAAAVFCLPAGPADFICVAGGFIGGLVVGTVGSAIGSAVGGAVHDAGSAIEDWMMEKAGEAYQHQIEQQGDPIPPEAQPAVDELLGPSVF